MVDLCTSFTLDWRDVSLSVESTLEPYILAKRAFIRNHDTYVCRFWLKGTCSKGQECPYRHSKGDKTIVCKHWLRGLCKKSDINCEYLHIYDLSRMPLCHFYLTYGSCNNTDCPFVHQSGDDRDQECPWYARGFCKKGPHCRQKHTRKEACPDYLAGFCHLGPECRFAHPKWEIILPEKKNIYDELEEDVDEESKEALTQQQNSQRRQFNNRNGPPQRYGGGPEQGGMGYNNSSSSSSNSNSFAAGGGHMGGPTGPPRRNLATVTCNKCKQQGHYATHCPNPPAEGSSRPLQDVLCFKCGEKGHYANLCVNPKRAPPPGGYPQPNKRQRT